MSIKNTRLTTNTALAIRLLQCAADINNKNNKRLKDLILVAEEARNSVDKDQVKRPTKRVTIADNPISLPAAIPPANAKATMAEPAAKKQRSEPVAQSFATLEVPDLLILANIRKGCKDPAVFTKLLCNYLFFQNEMCRVLVGRATVLQSSYKKHCAELQPCKELVSTSDLFICYLYASRRLSKVHCYCKDNVCDSVDSCLTLNTIFDTTMENVLDLTNDILIATYGTADDNLIGLIREDARLKKASQREWVGSA